MDIHENPQTENLASSLEGFVLTTTGENYQEHFSKGFDLITGYKNHGGTQKDAYDKISRLFVKYKNSDEKKHDLIGDWLDCVSGWAGNPEYKIWGDAPGAGEHEHSCDCCH